MERWNALSWAEWKERLTAAHALIYAKLPRRTKEALEMAPRARARIIAERKALLKLLGK